MNHTEFIQSTNQVNLFEMKLKNITTNLTMEESLYDYVMNNYDKLIWTVDKLRNVTPDINWDKISKGFFGRTNITGKILVLDTKFAYHINDVIKEVDKR